MKNLTWLISVVALLVLPACSSTRTIRIESNPPSANVILAEKVIGVTPLDISEDHYAEEFKQSYINVKVGKDEFEEKSLIIPTQGLQSFSVDLLPLDQKYFEGIILKNFQRPQNELVRELLQIQGLLFSKKSTEAEARLLTFQKLYPNIAAGYVLQANVALEKGDRNQAQLLLQRALTLDPKDNVVKRMLENLTGNSR